MRAVEAGGRGPGLGGRENAVAEPVFDVAPRVAHAVCLGLLERPPDPAQVAQCDRCLDQQVSVSTANQRGADTADSVAEVLALAGVRRELDPLEVTLGVVHGDQRVIRNQRSLGAASRGQRGRERARVQGAQHHLTVAENHVAVVEVDAALHVWNQQLGIRCQGRALDQLGGPLLLLLRLLLLCLSLALLGGTSGLHRCEVLTPGDLQRVHVSGEVLRQPGVGVAGQQVHHRGVAGPAALGQLGAEHHQG